MTNAIKQETLLILLALIVGFHLLSGCTPAPIYNSSRAGSGSLTAGSPHKVAPVSGAGEHDAVKQEETFRIGQVLFGVSSYYGPKFHGKMTANGEIFDQNTLTCAHKTLPFGTKLKVTLLETRHSVIVRVNDRGPYVGDRILDLSQEAGRRIGLLDSGTGEVSAQILELGKE